MSKARAKPQPFIHCTPKMPPPDQLQAAAALAIKVNPCNAPAGPVTPDQLAVMTSKYWGAAGVKLTVGFLDSANQATKNRILEYANAWGRSANMAFVFSAVDPQIRIARVFGDGYWSYVGIDLLLIPRTEATMNLAGFTEKTSDAEYSRVVPHEFGHSAGFPHEHLRRELVNRLDVAKTLAWGKSVLGWSEATIRHNILTPLDEASIMGSPLADEDSIMAYSLPASITKDGKPIRGGTKISPTDHEFAAKVYPPAVEPPPPPPVETEWWAVESDSFEGWIKSKTKPTVEAWRE